MITEEEAIEIYTKVTPYTNKDDLEAVVQEDRILVWKKNGYGPRAYFDEVEVFFDGRILSWEEGKPVDYSEKIELTLPLCPTNTHQNAHH